MTLIVEDGTGLLNSDSYDSVANADAYAAAFGRTEFIALSASTDKEIRLRKATQYLDTFFVNPYSPLVDLQSLAFPVQGLYRNGVLVVGVPTGVRKACLDLATYPGLPDLLPDRTINALKSRSVELEGIKKSEVYRDEILRAHYWVAERLMQPYTSGSGSGLVTGRLLPYG